MTVVRKTNPDHKARFIFGAACCCSCGWNSVTFYGKGARSEASKEWQGHREHCELVASIQNGTVA